MRKDFDFKAFIKDLKKNPESKRIINSKKLRKKILIICEGEKTEPNYFISFKKRLPKGVVDRVEIIGTGKNTKSIIQEAQTIATSIGHYDDVWVVFDRDSFPVENVNQACKDCEHNGFKLAFSNEAFELWYVLHFQYLDTKINRKQYIDTLNKILHSKGLPKYSKNMSNIYEILESHGDQLRAIRFAERLIHHHGTCSFSDMQPSTTVHNLVKELNEYIEK